MNLIFRVTLNNYNFEFKINSDISVKVNIINALLKSDNLIKKQ